MSQPFKFNYITIQLKSYKTYFKFIYNRKRSIICCSKYHLKDELIYLLYYGLKIAVKDQYYPKNKVQNIGRVAAISRLHCLPLSKCSGEMLKANTFYTL